MTAAQLDAAPRGEADRARHAFPLPPTPGAVPSVRHRVRAVLGGWDLPTGAADDVLLVTSTATSTWRPCWPTAATASSC
ncbi:hypothetical protein ACWEGQ_28775, partial [Streptomyces seoulensis]